ncbi:MAG: glycosyl hydrolase family 18 protein [Bacteroidota bacterium]
MTVAFQYAIQSGDLIWKIAENLQKCKDLTVELILAANPGVTATNLSIDEELIIPDTSTGEKAISYYVVSGDTLSDIATKINSTYGVTTQNILDANPAVDPALLGVGDRINIPEVVAQVVFAPIKVETQEGPSFTESIDINSTTLGDLKELIQTKLNIPVDLQTIGSKTIAPFYGDDEVLSSFGISSEGAILGVLSHGIPIGSGQTPGDFKMVVYYPAWAIYVRQYFLQALDYSMVTHLNYAFADINSDGSLLMKDTNADKANFASLDGIRKKYPHLKTMLSIGGWTFSTHFSSLASTETGINNFVNSAISIMNANNFDGLDIDWEFPVEGGVGGMIHSPNDKTNFTKLLLALRNALGSKLLTVTLSPRPLYHQNVEVSKIKSIVDWVNLMAYDYHGAFPPMTENSVTNFNAPLYASSGDPTPVKYKNDLNIDASVRSLLTLGLPAKQLVLGLSFYGRGFGGVEPGPRGDGLYQPYDSTLIDGSWPGPIENGVATKTAVFEWTDIFDNKLGKEDWKEYYHAESQSSWIYSPSKKVFIGYDSPQTIWNKTSYIVANRLGGAMAWDASCDRYNQLLYVANYVLKNNGIKATGGPIPQDSSGGVAWSDQTTAENSAAPISAITFSLTKDGIVGLQTEYGTTKSNWYGISSGTRTKMSIPTGRYITRIDIQTESTGVTFKGMKFSFDNGSSFTVGTKSAIAVWKSGNPLVEGPQYSVGAVGSYLFYLSGETQNDQLSQLSFEFRGVPLDSSKPFHPLQNMSDDSLAVQVAEAKSNYLGFFQGSITEDGVASFSVVSHEDPHFSFSAGSADAQFVASDEGGFDYEMGLHLKSVESQLVIGNPDNPAVLIEYAGPEEGFDIHEEMTFKNGQANIVLGNGYDGVDVSIGAHGFKMDSSIGGMSETLEFDKSLLKIGIDGEGFEINKNGIGIYFGYGPFTIHIHILSMHALETLFRGYFEIGKALFEGAKILFNAVAKAFGIVVHGIKEFFTTIFGWL